MKPEKRQKAFGILGSILQQIDEIEYLKNIPDADIKGNALKLNKLTKTLQHHNGWFTPAMVTHALKALGESLKEENIEKWLKPYKYQLDKNMPAKTVAVIMAGNVPAVGFHDFLSVLITGNKILGKLSSNDDKLLPAISNLLTAIEPEFSGFITLTTNPIKDFNAVIATGSNNSARYFEYYFGKYPGIIRKNRNGVAVLTGDETQEELKKLTDDIFLYYGLGCRNVAKLYLPKGYNFNKLLETIAGRKEIIENHKYFNNYEYNKAIYLVNKTKHYDTGNLIITENSGFASPVSVIFYSFYTNEQSLKNELMINREQIQCVVAHKNFSADTVEFGKSQHPDLWEYADGVDTVNFLLSI